MTSRVSKLVLAAAIAASLPAAASARDCDHGPTGAPVTVPAPAHPDRPPPYRAHARSWRERELAQVRAELRALDQERAAFHARFAHNPRKLRRYDRSYLERRAALEHRWQELQVVAWR